MTNFDKCIYCGSTDNLTSDHIPPKGIFPEPRPSNLIVVPCCEKCNSSFSKDDEYFRNMLVCCEPVYDDPNAKLINANFFRSLKRKEAVGFKRYILESLSHVEVVSPGGIHLGKMTAMKVDGKRIKKTLTRISKGLFYKIRGYSLPDNYEMTMTFEEGYLQPPKKFIDNFSGHWVKAIDIGNKNIFTYTYAVCDEDPNAMALLYAFYNKLCFWGVIVPSGPPQPKG